MGMELEMDIMTEMCKRQPELKRMWDEQQRELKKEKRMEHYNKYQPKSFEYNIKKLAKKN